MYAAPMSSTNGRAPGALVAAAAVMAGLAVGCGGGSLPHEIAVPRDPTPLTKCKVAASQSSPLVTEWPASEKARLEGLLAEGGVAVSYSGCEMTLLDACRVEGRYAFQRTTLSTDTVEIDDQDELYAKLPLGAVSLEGELNRSGRLALRTTVSGQLKFRGDPAKVPAGSACSGATHVITALSVGAFKMLSGGSVSAGGGVDVAGAGAGGRVSRAEEVMRQAGNPERCPEGSDEAAHADCSSPIQVFLRPLPKKPGEPGYMEPEDEKPPPNAVRMSFATPPEGTWTLQEEGGKTLCQLPCSRWVARDRTYILQMDTDGGVQRVKLPRVDYASGRQVDVGMLPPQGSKGLGIAATITGGVGILAGATLLFMAEDEPMIGIGTMGGGVGVLAIGIGVLAYSHGWKPEMKLSGGGDSAAAPRVILGPGALLGTF